MKNINYIVDYKGEKTMLNRCDIDLESKLMKISARSLDDQIRFYLNDDESWEDDRLYIAAMKIGGKYSIKIGKEDIFEKIKMADELIEKLKGANIWIFMVKAIFILFSVFLAICVNNIFFSMLEVNCCWLLTRMLENTIKHIKISSQNIKSKHSAEHMLINFIRIHKRLPRNIKEIQKYYRFSLTCGSSHEVSEMAETFVSTLIGIMFSFIINTIIIFMFGESDIVFIITIMVYIITSIAIAILTEKRPKLLKKIVTPLRNMLIVINQITLTTRKVKHDDIILAYIVARDWVLMKCPEIYKEDEYYNIMKTCLVDVDVG